MPSSRQFPNVFQLADGETVYSFLAAIARASVKSRLVCRITDGRCTYARPIWANGLRNLAACLPEISGITADDLLEHHTLAPLFAPLLSEQRRAALFEATMEINAGEPAIVSGSAGCSLRNAPTLRFCRLCKSDTGARPGWLCVHQCAGVLVCPRHPTEVLWVSNVSRSPQERRRDLVDVRDADFMSVCTDLDSNDSNIARRIAQSMCELLKGKCAKPGPERFRSWLREEFRRSGCAAPFGKVDLRAATSLVETWLGPRLRYPMGLPAPPRAIDDHWLVRLLGRRRNSVHPLYAVIACAALNRTISDALMEASVFVAKAKEPTKRMPRGISPAHLRYESAKPKLRQIWENSSMSVMAIARLLTVSDVTVWRWARKMRLHFPRKGPGGRVSRGVKSRRELPEFCHRLHEKRARWLALRRRGVGHSCRLPPTRAVYQWLARYDPLWLRRHLGRQKPRPLVDWSARDRVLAARVRPAADAIRLRFPPVRASRTRLVAQVGAGFVFRHSRALLPKTMRAITSSEESHREYVPRRLRLLHEHGSLTKRAFADALKKTPALASHPLIAELCDAFAPT